MNNKSILNKSLTDWEKLDNMTYEEIDFLDCPEITPKMLKPVTIHRGKKYHFQTETITLQIDRDVWQWLESKEESYQSYINTLLRACMEAQQ